MHSSESSVFNIIATVLTEPHHRMDGPWKVCASQPFVTHHTPKRIAAAVSWFVHAIYSVSRFVTMQLLIGMVHLTVYHIPAHTKKTRTPRNEE